MTKPKAVLEQEARGRRLERWAGEALKGLLAVPRRGDTTNSVVDRAWGIAEAMEDEYQRRANENQRRAARRDEGVPMSDLDWSKSGALWSAVDQIVGKAHCIETSWEDQDEEELLANIAGMQELATNAEFLLSKLKEEA